MEKSSLFERLLFVSKSVMKNFSKSNFFVLHWLQFPVFYVKIWKDIAGKAKGLRADTKKEKRRWREAMKQITFWMVG